MHYFVKISALLDVILYENKENDFISSVYSWIRAAELEIVTTHGHAISSRFLSHQKDLCGYSRTFVAYKTEDLIANQNQVQNVTYLELESYWSFVFNSHSMWSKRKREWDALQERKWNKFKLFDYL